MLHHSKALEERTLQLLTDFYELTMSQTYFAQGYERVIGTFDLYFRRVPEGGGFAIAAGLQQMISYLQNLRFSQEDLDYLRSLGKFSEAFLEYLRTFRFSCDVWAVPEGVPVFPNEPLVQVRGPIIEAQLVETMLLLTINHQTLIATKANRIARSAANRAVLEFGARRAQGYDASVIGARAAYIGGVHASSCTQAGMTFGVPLSGTMAHSFVQVHSSEYEAFCAYAQTYPDETVLLVDTYNTLQSGIPNAIRVAKEILEPQGKRLRGIRIDSGDLAYLTREARQMLDQAGMQDCKIVVSNALDEYLITDLLRQGACIDSFGVGERLITARAEPVFGGVYKLVSYQNADGEHPALKLSENPEKITTPCVKRVWRFYDRKTQSPIADLLTLAEEKPPEQGPFEIFHPLYPWKRKTLEEYEVRPLLVPIFEKGELVYSPPTLEEIRKTCQEQCARLWPSLLRFENPQSYPVDLSRKLWEIKEELLYQHAAEEKRGESV